MFGCASGCVWSRSQCLGVSGDLLLFPAHTRSRTSSEPAPRGSLLEDFHTPGIARAGCELLSRKAQVKLNFHALGMLSNIEVGDLENLFYTGKK